MTTTKHEDCALGFEPDDVIYVKSARARNKFFYLSLIAILGIVLGVGANVVAFHATTRGSISAIQKDATTQSETLKAVRELQVINVNRIVTLENRYDTIMRELSEIKSDVKAMKKP